MSKIIHASKDAFFVRGNVIIDVTDVQTNKIINTMKIQNMVVTSGRNLTRDLLGRANYAVGLNYFAIGTNNTAVNASDITLGTEVFRGEFTTITYAAGQLNIRYYLASGDANSNTLVEAGLFGDTASATANSGTLFARIIHPAITKTASIAVTYSWQINISI